MDEITPGTPLFGVFLDEAIKDFESQKFNVELSCDPSFDLLVWKHHYNRVAHLIPVYLVVKEEIRNDYLREVALGLPCNAYLYITYKNPHGKWMHDILISYDFLTEEERRQKLTEAPRYLS